MVSDLTKTTSIEAKGEQVQFPKILEVWRVVVLGFANIVDANADLFLAGEAQA